MKIETISVSGFKGAIIGCRLPMCKDYAQAEEKSDTVYYENGTPLKIGEKDLDLLKRLVKADNQDNATGQPNSKFLRMIHVQCSVEAPLYWWKECSTYKIGTTANSTSTMHKLASTPITMDCFEIDDFASSDREVFEKNGIVTGFVSTIGVWNWLLKSLESLRQDYNETKDKRYWKELIRLLPDSWLQTRMFDVDYATLRNMYFWRKNHKLTEWHTFCEWIETLPYAQELICN